MRKQQDKEFDSRLREKMRNFSATPPASLWENIDREINSPAVSRKKALYGWLAIAASVCLLAAAGFWLVQYRGPFEKEVLSVTAEQDSVSETQDSGVRVFNNSRRRDEAPAVAGGSAGNPEGASAEGGARPAEQAVLSGSGAAPSDRVEPSGGTAPSGREPAPATKQLPEPQADPESLNEPGPEPAPDALPGEDDRIQAIDRDVSRIAGLSEPAGISHPDLAEPTVTAAMPADRESRQQEDGASFLPKKIMEVSGIEKALDVVAAAVDNNGDRILSVAKNETSGKWNGVRLDLGLVTVSYKKPAKKTDTDKN